MASNLLRVYNSFVKPLQQTLISSKLVINNPSTKILTNVKPLVPITCQVRLVSFFTANTAETLWKSVTSVSNAGRNRGRGRGLAKKIRDLNRGQYIGMGKINMQWPGLTAPIVRGSTVLKQQRLPDDPEREAKIIKLRDSGKAKISRRQHPLERGWTSAKMGGKSLGPPDPINDEAFDGFDTKVVEHKQVHHMTGNLGRKRTFSSFVITGNKNGLCGIALGKAADAKTALRIAKNRAGTKLMYVPLYNDHTILHDFFSQFGSTKLYVFKKAEGYGLSCHRAIACACEVIGIKDIAVKIEGAINYQHIIKAFLIGLLKQKSLQELAEEKKLHLVELREENMNNPKVVGSPSVVRQDHEISSTEIMDFTQYVFNGKVYKRKPKKAPWYINTPGHQRTLRKWEYLRNQHEVRIRMFAEHGEIRSFLTDLYPEAKPKLWNKKRMLQEQAEKERLEAEN